MSTSHQRRRAVLAVAFATAAAAAVIAPVSPAIGAAHHGVVFTKTIGGKPGGIAIDESTHRAYVIDNDNAGTSSSLVVLSPVSHKVLKRIHVGTYSAAVVIDSVRHRAYVANSQDGTVAIVSTASNRLLRTTTVPGDPTGITIDPALRRVYVSDLSSDSVTVLSQKTNKVVTTFTSFAPLGPLAVDLRKHLVYGSVFNSSPGQLAVIDGVTGAAVRTVDVQDFPTEVVLDAAHHRGYASSVNNSVSVFDTRTGAALPSIDVDSATSFLAIDTHARMLYATVAGNSGGQPTDVVAFVSLATGSVVASVPVPSDGTGSGNAHVAVDRISHRIWESGSPATTGTVTYLK